MLGAYLLCLFLPLEGMRVELNIMEESLPVLEIFIVIIPWDNTRSLLFVPSEATNLGV